MSENRFFEKRGPFPLNEIAKVIGCRENFSQGKNFEISSFESLENATSSDLTFFNSSKYQAQSLKTKAAVCITSPNLSTFEWKYLPRPVFPLDEVTWSIDNVE